MRSETVKRVFFVLFVCGVLLALVLGTPSLFQHAVPGKRLPTRVWAYPLDDPGLYGSDALQRGAHFFKPVYTWSDYTDAPVRQLEVKLESETGLLPWIQAIDGDLHALVTYGGDLGAAAPRLADGTWAFPGALVLPAGGGESAKRESPDIVHTGPVLLCRRARGHTGVYPLDRSRGPHQHRNALWTDRRDAHHKPVRKIRLCARDPAVRPEIRERPPDPGAGMGVLGVVFVFSRALFKRTLFRGLPVL
jgi:hypothetical protein